MGLYPHPRTLAMYLNIYHQALPLPSLPVQASVAFLSRRLYFSQLQPSKLLLPLRAYISLIIDPDEVTSHHPSPPSPTLHSHSPMHNEVDNEVDALLQSNAQ